MIFFFLQKYNFFFSSINFFIYRELIFFLKKFNFIVKFQYLQTLIWQEGLLIDFLQKKISNNFINNFIIYASNIFNEKILYEYYIKFFIIYFLTFCHKYNFFEIKNITNFIFFILLFIFFILLFIFFILLFF